MLAFICHPSLSHSKSCVPYLLLLSPPLSFPPIFPSNFYVKDGKQFLSIIINFQIQFYKYVLSSKLTWSPLNNLSSKGSFSHLLYLNNALWKILAMKSGKMSLLFLKKWSVSNKQNTKIDPRNGGVTKCKEL